MDLKKLLSGIAVVIDDAFTDASTDEDDGYEKTDGIFKIVDGIENEWDLPFYKSSKIPLKKTWPNLLQTASFVLLDWKLWKSGSDTLEEDGTKKNIEFLEQAKNYLVPVFIFTNESPEDVEDKLPTSIYDGDAREKNFIFIQRKNDLVSGDSLNLESIEEWIRHNASVYALKTWEQAFNSAKKGLFNSMYKRSPDWPRVFWKAYNDDGVDPSSSLTHLINDSLTGRMRINEFEAEILADSHSDVPSDDLRALIGETCLRPKESLPEDEIRCGDLFQLPQRKFLLNIRPDCDCIPRNGEADDIELYCIQGERMGDKELSKNYTKNLGRFPERDWETVTFSVYENKSVRFNFKKLRIVKFSELKAQRIGRLLHPYLTGIQQRFALYLQRQGLPRIPEAAIPSSERSV